MKMKWLITLLAIALLLTGALLSANPVMAEDEQPNEPVEETAAPVVALGGQAGTTLTASVDTSATWKKAFKWSLTKTVAPDKWDLFVGDSATSVYTVAVVKSGFDQAAFISGKVCVTNGGAVATQNLAIALSVTQPPSKEALASGSIASPGELDAGETKCFAYTIHVDPAVFTGKTFKVTADVTITNHSGHLGEPFGPSPSADSVFPAAPVVLNDSILVEDTNGMSWTFGDSGSVSYEKTFECGASKDYFNKAYANPLKLDGKQSSIHDSATVKVTCYALKVSKDAETHFTRQYEWKIGKAVKPDTLTLSLSQVATVNYFVTVKAIYTDKDFKVTGSITVTNPAPMAAPLNAVNDVVSPDIAATVVCPSLSVPAKGSLTCTYEAALPDMAERTNTATALLQNYAYAADGSTSPAGVSEISGSAAVNFVAAHMSEVDECIEVTDSLVGALGTVCAADAPKTFEYPYQIGPYDKCGDYQVENIASFVTNDSGATGSASALVKVTIPCGGCTLTQGYWKTHSSYGPAPYDEGWAGLESTLFFLSGKTWYQVFWTPPAGNVYYNLAHQYMAAKLNILNGASSTPAVDAAISTAEYLLANTTPAQAAALKASSRALWTSTASTLDQYNNGYIGPGHCSE